MRRSQQVAKKNKTEIAGEEILTAFGIDFKSQFIVEDKFCVDVFIPSLKIVIQFDGDYWHGHPRKFNANDLRQKKRMALDISQDAYMAKLGYRILRFWESTIKGDPDFVREKIASIVIENNFSDYARDVFSIRF